MHVLKCHHEHPNCEEPQISWQLITIRTRFTDAVSLSAPLTFAGGPLATVFTDSNQDDNFHGNSAGLTPQKATGIEKVSREKYTRLGNERVSFLIARVRLCSSSKRTQRNGSNSERLSAMVVENVFEENRAFSLNVLEIERGNTCFRSTQRQQRQGSYKWSGID